MLGSYQITLSWHPALPSQYMYLRSIRRLASRFISVGRTSPPAMMQDRYIDETGVVGNETWAVVFTPPPSFPPFSSTFVNTHLLPFKVYNTPSMMTLKITERRIGRYTALT